MLVQVGSKVHFRHFAENLTDEMREKLLVGIGETKLASSISATVGRPPSRVESHNHPSYVEPYQGAATGVGGIVRDIMATGTDLSPW